MGDTIQPSAKEYHAVYAASFSLWSELLHYANSKPELPPQALSLSSAFARSPSFQPSLKIQHAKYRLSSHAYVTGFSEWASSLLGCNRGMSSFRQPVEITVSTTAPINFSIDESDNQSTYYKTWFHGNDENYISVLFLAWTYILSSRWSKIMPAECCMSYTEQQAARTDAVSNNDKRPKIDVFIGSSSPQEIRWWAAILATSQGWRANMTIGGDELLAPWSVSLTESPIFTLSNRQNTPRPTQTHNKPASFTEALNFLQKFCCLHGLEDQSTAALSAVLLLPSQRGNKSLTLPAPTMNGQTSRKSCNARLAASNKEDIRGGQSHQKPTDQDVDRLLTLSCYTRGIYSMLLGVLFQPGVECNQAGPWIQGAMDILTPIAAHQPWVLARMFVERSPAVAPLWIGAAILDLSKKLIRQASCGQILVDLNAAAWSNTIQSFIQEPVSGNIRASEFISRADECRLLFMAQAEDHTGVPICQWAPFGTTPITETDIEVRLHQDCREHILQYESFVWNCVGGERRFKQSPVLSSSNLQNRPINLNSIIHEQELPNPDDLSHSKEFISESATQSIFRWLRSCGFASHEKRLRSHEWLETVGYESEDEEEELEDNLPKRNSLSRVSSWVKALDETLGDAPESPE